MSKRLPPSANFAALLLLVAILTALHYFAVRAIYSRWHDSPIMLWGLNVPVAILCACAACAIVGAYHDTKK